MPNVVITIHEKENPGPALPGIDIAEVLELRSFVILEAGMESGKTSVAFHAVSANGDHFIFETSAAIMDGLAGAIRGAEIRFAEKKAKKN